MMEGLRRTDLLPAAGSLPGEPELRCEAASEALVDSGFRTAYIVRVDDRRSQLRAMIGGVELPSGAIHDLAARAARAGRPWQAIESENGGDEGPFWRLQAIPCGATPKGELVLVAADPRLSQREAQGIALWASNDAMPPSNADPCAELARGLVRTHEADAAAFALFARAGMWVRLHTRSGSLLATWRIPEDGVFSDAAQHGTVMMLGDLEQHVGAEQFAAMGLNYACIAGLYSDQGLPFGAVGVIGGEQLPMDVADRMLVASDSLGPQLMSVLARQAGEPKADESVVALQTFARRVGCRRFALYTRARRGMKLVSAHAEDGSRLMSPPDPGEEELVHFAAKRGMSISGRTAAAILVGDDTVLFASDPRKEPLERLRLALNDLRGHRGGEEEPYRRAA